MDGWMDETPMEGGREKERERGMDGWGLGPVGGGLGM